MSESTLEGSAIATNSLDKAKEKPKSTLFSSQKKPFKKKELVQMFRSLASMLRAQISTADAIKYYAHGHPSKDMVGSLNQICGDINKGVPVHSAFKRSERFDDMTIGLIQAGGDTGQLDTAFAELGKRIKNEIHFRKKIRKTAEAESEEAFHASTDVVAMRELMREIGLPQTPEPTTIYCDNTAAIQIMENKGAIGKRSKAMDTQTMRSEIELLIKKFSSSTLAPVRWQPT